MRSTHELIKLPMTRLKLYAFEGMVWLREELLCVSAKHEAFKLRIRAFCSLTSPSPQPPWWSCSVSTKGHLGALPFC